VALVLTSGNKNATGSAYYQARKYLEQLTSLDDVHLQPLSEFDVSTDEWGAQLTSAYAPQRSAVLVKDGQIWGVIGEFSEAVKSAFKLPQATAGFEVHIAMLQTQPGGYRPLSRFPSTWQDISLKVANDVNYSDVYENAKRAAINAAPEVDFEIAPVSIYQSQDDTSHKTITLRVKLTHHSRTLTEKDASAVIEAIASSAGESLQAIVS